MASKTAFLFGAIAAVLQPALAVPTGHEVPAPILRRGNITVEPPKNITPIITELGDLTQQELEELIKEIESGVDKLITRDESALAGRQASPQGTDGALLTFSGGPTSGQTTENCVPFVINGPFTTIHPFMGSSNFRGILATSFSGNSTEIHAGETIRDAGEYTFKDNERITKFSVAYEGRDGESVNGFKFETDAGNTFEALSENIVSGKVPNQVYTDLNVGSGIIARITGTNCSVGVFTNFGIDFLDELDSIAITNIDYSGFTNNIMPAGAGTQLSIGSQVLDNRNSSEKQTITLTTTDAITSQRTVTTQIRALVGGSVSIEASAGVPLISSGKTTAEANWQIETLSVSPNQTSLRYNSMYNSFFE